MNVTVGKTVSDNVAYDVLYLHVGDPGTASTSTSHPKEHALRYDVVAQPRFKGSSVSQWSTASGCWTGTIG
jgi:hypothetical protein